MIEVALFNSGGKSVGKLELPESVFALPLNVSLLTQLVRVFQNWRLAKGGMTKSRAEVRGGGKKPWQQKGTGRARHGSRRSPLWVGGGVSHGPQGRVQSFLKLNRKMSQLALGTALSLRLKEKKLLVVEEDAFSPKGRIKTADLLKMVNGLTSDSPTLVITAQRNENLTQAARNLLDVSVIPANFVDALTVLKHPQLVLTSGSVATLCERVEKRKSAL